MTAFRNFTAAATMVAGVALAALAYAPGAAQAQTASNPDQVSVRISYGDLDLSSQTGAREMIGRIDNAARVICGEPSSNADLSGWAQQRACAQSTVSDAVASLGNPTVTALNDQRRGEGASFANR